MAEKGSVTGVLSSAAIFLGGWCLGWLCDGSVGALLDGAADPPRSVLGPLQAAPRRRKCSPARLRRLGKGLLHE